MSFYHEVPVRNVWCHVLVPPRSYKSNLSCHNFSFPVSELFCLPVETESQFHELEPSKLSPGTRALWDHLQLQKTLCFFYCVGRLLPWIIIICSCTSPLRDQKPKHVNASSLPEPPSPNSVRMAGSALPSTKWECVTFILKWIWILMTAMTKYVHWLYAWLCHVGLIILQVCMHLHWFGTVYLHCFIEAWYCSLYINFVCKSNRIVI